MPFWRNIVVTVGALLFGNLALAQQQGAMPGSASKTVPSRELYESAFATYKPYREPELVSWRAANDQVRQTGGMGGMEGHDMGGSAPAAAAPVPASGGAPSPAASGHAQGHDMSGMDHAMPTPASVKPKPQGESAPVRK